MQLRTLLYGLVIAVVIFVVGSSIGAVWEDDDTAGAITVFLWAMAALFAVPLVIGIVIVLVKSRRAGRDATPSG